MRSYTVGFEIMYVLTLFRNNSKIKKGRDVTWMWLEQFLSFQEPYPIQP